MEFGVIGEHLPHTFSPEIHRLIGDYAYTVREMPPEAVPAFLKERAFRGINVTIPYKELVMPYLDEIDDAARAVGSVNTVVNRGGRLIGYNTDVDGLTALIRRVGADPAGKPALIFGSGGTAHTARAVLKALGASEITTVSRHPQDGAISYAEARTRRAALLVNTTPCGMFPHLDTAAFDPAEYPDAEAVVDVVYNPLRTKVVQQAQARGIPADTGLYMLVVQAIAAAEHFLREPVPPARAEAIFRRVRQSKENIVLTGMPSCGKSTVGRALADALSRPFFDADEEIVREAGEPISALFAKEGEAAFRERETAVISRCLAGKTGCVIATGGGAVLREENIRLLRQNGRIFFLDRPLDRLTPTGDRPTASSAEALRRRFEERYPLYCARCDRRIPAGGSVEEVVKAVKEAFEA